jgi:hypothetical protein
MSNPKGNISQNPTQRCSVCYAGVAVANIVIDYFWMEKGDPAVEIMQIFVQERSALIKRGKVTFPTDTVIQGIDGSDTAWSPLSDATLRAAGFLGWR